MAETPIGYDEPLARFTQYCNLTYGAGTVIGTSGGTPPNDPGFVVEFGPNVSTLVQSEVLNVVNNPSVFGGWAPLPIPDTNGFRHDVITDPNAPNFPLALLLAYVVSDPSLSYSDRKIFASTASGWIASAYPTQASAILTTIENYAVNRWVPLI